MILTNLTKINQPIIVNVVTDKNQGGYLNGQQRLIDSCIKYNLNHVVFRGEYPPSCPSHKDHPYAFKIYALNYVRKNILTNCKDWDKQIIIWADSPVWFCKDPTPLVEAIIKDGLVTWGAGETGATLARYCSDDCLKILHLTREEAKEIPLLCGSIYGFNMKNQDCSTILDSLLLYQLRGAFIGPTMNTASPKGMAHHYGAGYRGRPEYKCSDDPQCWGHRHDETVISYLVWKHKIGHTYPLGQFFCGYSPTMSETVVACSQGC